MCLYVLRVCCYTCTVVCLCVYVLILRCSGCYCAAVVATALRYMNQRAMCYMLVLQSRSCLLLCLVAMLCRCWDLP